MRLSKGAKIAVGLATAWVTLYPLLFFVVWITTFAGFMTAGVRSTEPNSAMMIPFMAIFPLHCITIGLIFGLMAFYMVHIIKNREGSEVLRIICGVGLSFMPYVAMPLYFFAYIWPDTPPDWALEKPKTTAAPVDQTPKGEQLG